MRILLLVLVCSMLTASCTPSSEEASAIGSPPNVLDSPTPPTTRVPAPAAFGPWRLAFASEAPGRQGLDVYVAKVPGGKPRLLAGVARRNDFSPSLSADGRWVAYRLNPLRGDEGDIHVVATRGGRSRNLTRSDGVADWSPSWAPTGEKIAFFSNQGGALDVWIMDHDGSNKMRLTDDAALDEYPTWSPDARRIAFQSTRDGEFDVFVMQSDGDNVVNITQHPARDQWASWSPDGEWIAFMSDRDGSEDVFVVRPNGSEVRNLTATSDLQESHPAWLPDSTLTFSRHGESGPISLWAVSIDGQSETQIHTESQPVFVYSWGPLAK